MWNHPAIFPASATLIEKHVRERKEKEGPAWNAARQGGRARRRSGTRKLLSKGIASKNSALLQARPRARPGFPVADTLETPQYLKQRLVQTQPD
jgi:hypothetical protein